jgi:hypothetical protein
MLALQGRFHTEIWTPSACRGRETFSNGLISLTINNLLDVYFRAVGQSTNWYAGLIDNAGFSALDASDSMSSHPNWVENLAYTAAARLEWIPSAAIGGLVTNPTPMQYTMNADVTIQGLFISSSPTKAGTAGILWAHGQFTTPQILKAGEILKAFYQLTARQG